MIGCRLSVGLFLLVAPWIQAQPADAQAAEWLGAADCPDLFGDAADHALNQKRRERALLRVDESDFTINLVHSGDWSDPLPIALTGLDLVETRAKEQDDPARLAIVELSPDLLDAFPEMDCIPGRYALKADDDLGEQGRILAVLSSAMLVELDQALYYVPVSEREHLTWRCIWRSGWTLPREPGKQKSTNRGARSTRTPNNRRNRRR